MTQDFFGGAKNVTIIIKRSMETLLQDIKRWLEWFFNLSLLHSSEIEATLCELRKIFNSLLFLSESTHLVCFCSVLLHIYKANSPTWSAAQLQSFHHLTTRKYSNLFLFPPCSCCVLTCKGWGPEAMTWVVLMAVSLSFLFPADFFFFLLS